MTTFAMKDIDKLEASAGQALTRAQARRERAVNAKATAESVVMTAELDIVEAEKAVSDAEADLEWLAVFRARTAPVEPETPVDNGEEVHTG